MTTIKASELRKGDVIRSGECDGWTVVEAGDGSRYDVWVQTDGGRLSATVKSEPIFVLTLERENDYFASGTPADFDPIETRTAWLHADDTVEIERVKK